MNRILKYCCILLFSCLILSCQVKVPYGSLKVIIETPAARSISPVADPVPDSYTIRLASGMTGALLKSVNISPDSSSVLFDNLVPGTYEVHAIGYTDSEPVSFSSRASVSIKEGAVAEQILNPVSVQVSPDAENPLFGTVSIPVSWTTDMDVDSILLVNAEGDIIASSKVVSGKREALLKSRIEVGERTVRLRILKDNEILYESAMETLQVFSGSISEPVEGTYLNLVFEKANPVSDFAVLTADKNNELSVSFTVPANLENISSAKVTLSDGTEKEISMGLLQSFSGKLLRLSFTSLESDREYTASLTFIRNNGSTTLSTKATGRTLIDARTLDIETDNSAPAIGDTITFTSHITPDEASNLGIVWTTSDESVLTIDNDGKAVALKEGTATVTCTLKNKGLSKSLSVSIRKPESAIRTERTDYGFALCWDQVKNATGYMVEYAFGDEEYTLLKTSDETSAMHAFTPVTGSKLTYRVWALFFDGVSSALIGTESLIMEANDPMINIDSPTLPDSSLITINGIVEGQCLTQTDFLTLSATSTEKDGVISWYINTEKAGEGETLVLSALSPGIDLTTKNGCQSLMVIIRTPDKVLSRSLTFCLMTVEDDNNNHDKGGI